MIPIPAFPGVRGDVTTFEKSPEAFRTISEAADDLGLPQHVLRFWETRFPQIKPLKRGGGRRYYRPDDIELLRAVKQLLYGEGYTIKGVQRLMKEQGARAVAAGALAPGAERSDPIADPASGPVKRKPPAPVAAALARAAPLRRDDPAEPAPNGGALTPADLQALRAALAEISEGERILALALAG